MDELLRILAELGMSLDDITEIEALTDEQLAEAEEHLLQAYTEAREERDLERAREIADEEGHLDTVRAEAARRIDEAMEAEEALQALDERATPAEIEPEPEPETEVEPEPEVEDEPETPTAETEPEPEVEAEPEPVAADATPRPRLPRPPRARAQVREPEPLATITAAAEMPGLHPGQPIAHLRDLGESFTNRAKGLLRSASARGRFDVANIQVEYPQDRVLGDSASENTRRIGEVVAAAQQQTNADLARLRTASVDDIAAGIVADGGLCAPTNVSYDVFGVGTEERPIRDGILGFNADRGGITFITPPQLTDLAGAVDIITEAEDTAGNTDKPCLTVTCGAETEETVSAVSKCLQIGNFHHRTFREHFDRFWTLAGIQHSREAETELWDRMVAASTAVTTGQILGFYRDLVENLVQAATGMRSRHRAGTTPVRAVIPEWAVAMASIDLLRQIPGDDTYAVTEAFLRRSLAAHNIALTLTPDTGQEFQAQVAGPLSEWPDTLEALVFFEGTFVFLDQGMLNFGMEIRDSTLNASNNLQAMAETFEGVAMVGVEALHVDMDICASGASSGTEDINCTTSGS